MKLNQYILHARKSSSLSQKNFYKDIMSHPSAVKFEKNNADVIKLFQINDIAARVDLTTHELLEICKEDFCNDIDRTIQNFFLFISPYLEDKSKENAMKTNEYYKLILQKKEASLIYFNLYLAINIQVDFLNDVTRSDLLILKKLIKKKSSITSIDYKILSNLFHFFSVEKLTFLFDRLYPVSEGLSGEAINHSLICINNLCSIDVQRKKLTAMKSHLAVFQNTLNKYPSYKFSLLKEHLFYLHAFLDRKNTDDFNRAFEILNIIGICEGDNSKYADNLKESMLGVLGREGIEPLASGGIVGSIWGDGIKSKDIVSYVDKPFFE